MDDPVSIEKQLWKSDGCAAERVWGLGQPANPAAIAQLSCAVCGAVETHRFVRLMISQWVEFLQGESIDLPGPAALDTNVTEVREPATE